MPIGRTSCAGVDEHHTPVRRPKQAALRKLEKKIKNASYNFYFHTAPVRHKSRYGFYHWHIQVVPRLNISAGFELTTGMEVNNIFPEDAVKILNSK